MGKITNNVVKCWKSTILGFIIIIAAVVSVFYFPGIVNWWPQATAAIVVGTLLMLSPDTLIKSAEGIIGKLAGVKVDEPTPAPKKSNKKTKQEEETPEPDEPIV